MPTPSSNSAQSLSSPLAGADRLADSFTVDLDQLARLRDTLSGLGLRNLATARALSAAGSSAATDAAGHRATGAALGAFLGAYRSRASILGRDNSALTENVSVCATAYRRAEDATARFLGQVRELLNQPTPSTATGPARATARRDVRS